MTFPAEERQLILAARKGSHEAFRAIVERNHARLYEVVFRIVRNRADAEEVTQETFLRAYKNLARFAFDSALYTWLYRIAVNAAVDLAKRRKRRAHVSLDHEEAPLGPTLPSHGPRISEILVITPEASVLRRKLSGYPPSDTTPS